MGILGIMELMLMCGRLLREESVYEENRGSMSLILWILRFLSHTQNIALMPSTISLPQTEEHPETILLVFDAEKGARGSLLYIWVHAL